MWLRDQQYLSHFHNYFTITITDNIWQQYWKQLYVSLFICLISLFVEDADIINLLFKIYNLRFFCYKFYRILLYISYSNVQLQHMSNFCIYATHMFKFFLTLDLRSLFIYCLYIVYIPFFIEICLFNGYIKMQFFINYLFKIQNRFLFIFIMYIFNTVFILSWMFIFRIHTRWI